MNLNPLVALALPTVLGTVGGGIAGWLSARQKARLDRQNQEALAAENFEYSRGLQEHSLYIAKKHEIVAGLHAKITDALSKIMNIALGQSYRPVFDAANESDVQKLMGERQVLDGVQQRVLALWSTDRGLAERELQEWLEGFAKEEAQRSHVRARNYLLDQQLYLSAGTYELATHLLARLEQELWQFRPPLDWDPKSMPAGDQREIFELQKRLIASLKSDLSPAVSRQ